MMIKKVTNYTVICDSCKADALEHDEYVSWNDDSFAESCALENDYIEHEGKHYCPKCYEYDDNDDLIIKTPEQ